MDRFHKRNFCGDGYTLEEMKFEWRSDKDAVQINPHIQFPQFDLVDKNVTYCQKSYITGNFTCLRAVFHLHRHFGYYMIQNYIPSGLIVVLSWVSFWISTDAVPARITLGVLTVLTMTTQCVGIWMSLPMVSYIKAIDIWMSTCVMSVFFAMLEFAVVNTMSRKEARDMAKMRPTADNDDKHIEQQVKDMIEFHTFDTEPQNCSTARFIDKASRLMFPLFFVVFNVVYWCYFLTQ
ncbi:hypothetical protein CAPTEDRAFT_219971 [Capitella teleta]|uniref:Neurotransmitter-gated ion-channel transmembrane domain-containing protein n=1 Tax=Capitella teleta TaxID=283909 RepID=R7UAF8_CAPTE|nr:hypothetical protein CAPTEDRAFT_219971 [Capitella teleta]|eukprot:ELU02929.1 hypothetical protein CAPTEDRAFT_219971 [Capitella teleta]